MAKTNTLTVVKPDIKTHAKPEVRWRERAVSARWLFRSETEDGRRGWFVRLDITGLYTRRIGPFPTRAAAMDCLEDFLGEIVTRPLTELQNTVPDERYYVVEGIPRLKGQ